MEKPPGLCLARYAMGTRFEMVLIGDDEVRLRAAGEEALDEIENLDARLDLFKRNSLVCHVNRSAFNAPVRVDSDFFELLRLCQRVSEASSGAFDITVGALMESWGFHAGTPVAGKKDARTGDARRDDVLVDDVRDLAKDRVGYRHIELDEAAQTIRLLRPGMRLDFGAVAKGFALDRAKEILLEAGVEDALMHGGTSTIVAMGSPDRDAAWKVAIEDPRRDDAILASAMLHDRALSVSAPRGRTIQAGAIEKGAQTLGHVMNVAEAGPARAPLELSAVLGESATLADAWATAMVACGASRLAELVEAAGAQMKPLTVLVAESGGDPDREQCMGDEIEVFTFPDPSSGQQE